MRALRSPLGWDGGISLHFVLVLRLLEKKIPAVLSFLRCAEPDQVFQVKSGVLITIQNQEKTRPNWSGFFLAGARVWEYNFFRGVGL